jgi:uncharacterized protein DUF4159
MRMSAIFAGRLDWNRNGCVTTIVTTPVRLLDLAGFWRRGSPSLRLVAGRKITFIFSTRSGPQMTAQDAETDDLHVSPFSGRRRLEFPIVDVAPADPIRHTLFNITEVRQVPSIFSWGGPGSDPRERGSDSPHADFRAIADSHGRIMVAMTHNTDIGDSMEREGDDPGYFAAFSPDGYALATDIVLYALTH